MKKRKINKRAPNSPNTRRMQENILLICLNYVYMGIDFIIASIIECNPSDPDFKYGMILGILMLCMVPISYFDDREERRGKLYAVMGFIVHLGISIGISLMYLCWWNMILYAVEFVISMSIVYIKHTRYKK